jgi:hypothetical protein
VTGSDAELTVASGGGGAQLAFRFPDIGATGPIRIVVGSTERKARAELATVRCGGALGADVAACIDARQVRCVAYRTEARNYVP